MFCTIHKNIEHVCWIYVPYDKNVSERKVDYLLRWFNSTQNLANQYMAQEADMQHPEYLDWKNDNVIFTHM